MPMTREFGKNLAEIPALPRLIVMQDRQQRTNGKQAVQGRIPAPKLIREIPQMINLNAGILKLAQQVLQLFQMTQ